MSLLTRESHLTEQMARTNEGRSYSALVWAQFKRDRYALVALVFVCILLVIATLAPVLANDKPLLMRLSGRMSSPLLREVFAPSNDTPELMLERFFNFVLVFSVVSLLTLLPLCLIVRRGPAGRWILPVASAVVALACLIPFFLIQSRLDTTDYKTLAKSPGDWAIYAPWQFGPFRQTAAPYLPPDSLHSLGTDSSGRDVLARIIHGARISLSVGFLSVAVAVVIGVFIGAVSAYHGGILDLLLQRLVEVVICFPTFLLILTIMAYFEKRSIMNVMLVIGLTGWTGFARLVRGQMLTQKKLDYVTAAQALGIGSWRIIFRHLLPNSIAPVLVGVSFSIAGAILTESGLSFLGFGVSPPTASWGQLLNQALSSPTKYWWLTLWPGLMIFVSVTLYNLVGEGLRDALDPRLKI